MGMARFFPPKYWEVSSRADVSSEGDASAFLFLGGSPYEAISEGRRRRCARGARRRGRDARRRMGRRAAGPRSGRAPGRPARAPGRPRRRRPAVRPGSRVGPAARRPRRAGRRPGGVDPFRGGIGGGVPRCRAPHVPGILRRGGAFRPWVRASCF